MDKQKTAIIIAAGTSIGAATARKLAADGCRWKCTPSPMAYTLRKL